MRIHLNIGSNSGDRMSFIGRAVALLSCRLPASRIYLSDYIESKPWGFDSTATFLNRGILVLTPHDISPEDVLDIIQKIENDLAPDSPHRNPDGSYRDRNIDIDIIDIDGMNYASPRLTLPHPRASLRPFVVEPMNALNERFP